MADDDNVEHKSYGIPEAVIGAGAGFGGYKGAMWQANRGKGGEVKPETVAELTKQKQAYNDKVSEIISNSEEHADAHRNFTAAEQTHIVAKTAHAKATYIETKTALQKLSPEKMEAVHNAGLETLKKEAASLPPEAKEALIKLADETKATLDEKKVKGLSPEEAYKAVSASMDSLSSNISSALGGKKVSLKQVKELKNNIASSYAGADSDLGKAVGEATKSSQAALTAAETALKEPKAKWDGILKTHASAEVESLEAATRAAGGKLAFKDFSWKGKTAIGGTALAATLIAAKGVNMYRNRHESHVDRVTAGADQSASTGRA